jgi:protease-4
MTSTPNTIVIQQPSKWWPRVLLAVLVVSLLFNVRLYFLNRFYYAGQTHPSEQFHSGDISADDKIAVLKMSGVIMPPFTERLLRAIDAATVDDAVKGVLLEVDSPGGLVADSHQIYHRLQRLAEKKPIYVAMKRMAASGGYYISMGAGPEGRIFVEPTTWTGSIGVIIPRYNATELANKFGVTSDSLKTGEFKDSLNPFRDLTPREREVWDKILDDAFGRFVAVISRNRPPLDDAAVRALATGQIYTANQALENGLVDEIGFADKALEALQEKLGLSETRVITYYSQPSLIDLALGTAQAAPRQTSIQTLMDVSVPRAMYYCSWAPIIPY